MEEKTNYHTHSKWCDGRDTVEEIAAGAEGKGFAELGFSSHAMLPADPLDWPLTAPRLAAYAECVRSVARAHEGRLRVLCGVEADYVKGACSPDRQVYAALSPDYVIGSVHFVVAPDGAWVAVDESPDVLAKGIADHFGGSGEAFVRAYFEQQREMASGCDFDIIGHADLCRKFNGRLGYFDEGAAWYRDALAETADAFAASGKVVEVNTGAISRGWMDDAYPSAAFRDELRSRGVRFVLSSDAHSADALDCAFDRFGRCEDFVRFPF
jgi:histidinol-phosphatase (PHP family)